MLLKDIGSKYGRRKLTLFTHMLLVIIFSGVYYESLSPDDFNGGEGLKNYSDYLYFTIVTHASVGYGDISPKTKKAKILVSTHIVLAFVFIISLWI
tara:strand:+ start:53 stop:340 length:288 start_codon:yes stop_codon:yes gene_type:complete